MDHHAAVLVQVDHLSASVRLVVSGCLTERNQQAVRPLVLSARTLIPPGDRHGRPDRCRPRRGRGG